MFREMTIQVRVPLFTEGRQWYDEFIGRTPDYIPHEGFAEWELTPKCWLQVAEGEPANGSGPIRVEVQDMDEELKRLERGLGIQDVEVCSRIEVPVKWCTFSDPWGNRFGYFEYIENENKGMGK